MEEAMQAFQSIDSDYDHHCRAAYALAGECFSYDVLLPRLLADLGLSHLQGETGVDMMS
jgi:hypothetical protein